MISPMTKHFDKLAHLFLYGALAIGAVGLYFSRFSATRQFILILLLVAFYLVWGLIYHNLRRDISNKLMIEYLIIASLALLASYFVLLS